VRSLDESKPSAIRSSRSSGADVRTLLMTLVAVACASAQTIVFAPQDFSRIQGLNEFRVYVSAPLNYPLQMQGMQVMLEGMKQGIRIYSYVNLRAYIDDLNQRSIWRWVGIVGEAGGWAMVSGTTLEALKIKEKSIKAGITGGASLLTIGRTIYDREYKPVELPADIMQPLFAVPGGQAVEFSVWGIYAKAN